ncbi:MAG: DUF1566 domain-containing protein [Thiobacillaceae bacterium]
MNVLFRRFACLMLFAAVAWPLNAGATLILSADHNEVLDSSTGLTWLANGNLPASMSFGLSCSQISGPNCITQGGSMNFVTALEWMAQLNQNDYEGHNNWQLPTFGRTDAGCTATGTNGNSFAFGCSNNAFGSLYYGSLGLHAPSSALLQAQNTVGPFTNFQPNNYWSGTPRPGTSGALTFSFATGLVDSIVGKNSYNDPNPEKVTAIGGDFLNVLPMIQGTPTAGGGPLQSIYNGHAVFDPKTGAIFTSNANLAATFANSQQLMTALNANLPVGLQVCQGVGIVGGVNSAPPCISVDGTMNWTSAQLFIQGLNTMVWNGGMGYLGQQDWCLPPHQDANTPGQTCAGVPAPTATPATSYDPMSSLYYDQLNLTQGEPVAPAPLVADASDPLTNLQPEYYWGCDAVNQSNPIHSACDLNSPGPPETTGFGWDFSLGNGYLSTDVQTQDFFVTAYFNVPEPSTPSIVLPGLGLLAFFGRWRRRACASNVRRQTSQQRPFPGNVLPLS